MIDWAIRGIFKQYCNETDDFIIKKVEEELGVNLVDKDLDYYRPSIKKYY